MEKTQPISPRRRMQELLAIPDNVRSDAEWDELNELEIQLAQGNRIGAPDPGGARRNPAQQQRKGRPFGDRPADANNRRGGQGNQQGRPGGGNAANGNVSGGNAGAGNQVAAAPAGANPGGQNAAGPKPPRKFHKRPPPKPAPD